MLADNGTSRKANTPWQLVTLGCIINTDTTLIQQLSKGVKEGKDEQWTIMFFFNLRINVYATKLILKI